MYFLIYLITRITIYSPCIFTCNFLFMYSYHHLPLTAATPSSSHQQPRPCPDLQVRENKKFVLLNEARLLVMMRIHFSHFCVWGIGGWSLLATKMSKQFGRNQEHYSEIPPACHTLQHFCHDQLFNQRPLLDCIIQFTIIDTLNVCTYISCIRHQWIYLLIIEAILWQPQCNKSHMNFLILG